MVTKMDNGKCKTCYYDGICEDVGVEPEEQTDCEYYLDEDIDSNIEQIDEFIYREGLEHRQQSYMELVKEQEQ